MKTPKIIKENKEDNGKKCWGKIGIRRKTHIERMKIEITPM
jgi:hypothetical protein